MRDVALAGRQGDAIVSYATPWVRTVHPVGSLIRGRKLAEVRFEDR